MIYTQYMTVAGITIRLISPVYLSALDGVLARFAEKNASPADVTYTLCAADGAPYLGRTVHEEFGVSVYETEDEYIRKIICSGRYVYTVRKKSDTSKYDIYADGETLSRLAGSRRLINALAMEDALLCRDAFMLHGAVMVERGRAVVLTAPAGTGKTTHSELWRRLFGSEIINGDCAVIRKSAGTFFAYSPPLSGSSEIEQNAGAPIGAVVCLRQAERNGILPFSEAEKFLAIYSESTVNSWNEAFVEKTTQLIQQLLASTPVTAYGCNKSDESARLLYNNVFYY